MLKYRRLNSLKKEDEGENQASEKDLTHGAFCELSTIKQHALLFPFKVCLNGSVSLCSSLPVSLNSHQPRTKSRPAFSGVLMLWTFLTGEAGIASKLLGGLKKLLFSVGIVCCIVLGVVSKLWCGRMYSVNVWTNHCWSKCLHKGSVYDYREWDKRSTWWIDSGAVLLTLPWDKQG